jgi:hypothetical protein
MIFLLISFTEPPPLKVLFRTDFFRAFLNTVLKIKFIYLTKLLLLKVANWLKRQVL